MPVNIVKTGPLGPFANNAYVIVDEATRQALLVDAPADARRALEAAPGARVTRIVVTHRHGDHWMAIDEVRRLTGAPVACHEADRAPHAASVDGTVADGEEVRIGESVVRVLHTPGHTPGSICLLAETAAGPALISGDTLFPGGPGRSDTPEALREMIASIRARLLPLDDATRVLPGHGDDTTIGAARREIAVFDSREHPADLCGDVLWEG
ncbi:MAG TPA: MBL fold metallo-hydrolase [Dehalococcoidia bacterium]|jgi:hydroxyacylglutathione hydrolase|nr:MBL fold metallo-hydrolase [Dehalococcoidia bacterium]